MDSWDDELILPTTYRLNGKKHPAMMASQDYIDQVQSKIPADAMRVSKETDIQTPQLSHQEWHPASDSTSKSLDQKCR